MSLTNEQVRVRILNVVQWLESGCSPGHAAVELAMLAKELQDEPEGDEVHMHSFSMGPAVDVDTAPEPTAKLSGPVARYTSRFIYGDDVTEDADGEYVAYSAYEALANELAALKAARSKSPNQCGDGCPGCEVCLASSDAPPENRDGES